MTATEILGTVLGKILKRSLGAVITCLDSREKEIGFGYALLTSRTVSFSPGAVGDADRDRTLPAPGKRWEQPCSLPGPSTCLENLSLCSWPCLGGFFLVQRATGEKATGTQPGVAACVKAGPEPSESAFGEQSWGRGVPGLLGGSGLCFDSERHRQSNAAFPGCRQKCLQPGRSAEGSACVPLL